MPLTTLDAVNEILEALGESSFTSLPGTGTIADEASDMLTRERKRILTVGFAFNTNLRKAVELTPANTEIAGAGSISGTFQYGETVTGGTSSATGTFRGQDGTLVYIDTLTGTFQASETITGGTSSASFTSGTVTGSVTTGPIWVDEDWLTVKPFEINSEPCDSVRFTQEGLQLRDVENNTLDWSQTIKVTRVTDDAFTDIPNHIARYIVAWTAEKFQQFKKRGRIDAAMLMEATRPERIRMNQIESDLNGRNINDTHQMDRIRGHRSPNSFLRIPHGS